MHRSHGLQHLRHKRPTRRNRGLPSPGHSTVLCYQCNYSVCRICNPDSATLLYTYISRFSVNPHYRQQLYLRPSFIVFFNFLYKRPTFAFTSESGYTLGFPRKIAHNGTHAETGAFRTGPLSLPSERSARSRTSPGRVSERRTLPLWDLGREGLSKNAESLRDSDALMRVAVPKASRPRWAALLCLQFGDVAVFSLCAQGFPHMRKRGWYHYPRCAPRAAETLGGRLSKRLICRFLRSGGHH